MEDKNYQSEINELNKKLDVILEEIELQRKHRKEMEDLKDDLMRIGTDVFQTAVVELDEMHDSVNSGDILFLLKKLLRNVNNITKTFELLENVKGFFEDFSPISRELILDSMKNLDAFDRKGYFDFVKELKNVADNVVTSFSVDDVKALGDNIVTILNTVKSLTQPDMLNSINNAVSVYKKLDIEVAEEISVFTLIKRLNKPEVRRGMAFGLKFLESLVEPEAFDKTKKNKSITK